MPLVERSHERRTEPSHRCPLQAPSRTQPGKRRPPGPKQKNAQDEIPDKMSGFAEQHVPERKSRIIHAEKIMKQGKKNPPRVGCGANICRFNRDDCQPDGRRDPYFKDSLGGRGQRLNSTNAIGYPRSEFRRESDGLGLVRKVISLLLAPAKHSRLMKQFSVLSFFSVDLLPLRNSRSSCAICTAAPDYAIL